MVSFIGAIAQTTAAIRISGDGTGARVILEIPENQKDCLKEIMNLRNRPIVVWLLTEPEAVEAGLIAMEEALPATAGEGAK